MEFVWVIGRYVNERGFLPPNYTTFPVGQQKEVELTKKGMKLLIDG